MTDKGCSYEQLANWHDQSNKIFIDQGLYEKMQASNLNVAALLLHEAAYKVSRVITKVEDSNRVRKFVGEVFSTSEIKTSIAGFDLPPSAGLFKDSFRSSEWRIQEDFKVGFENFDCVAGAYLEITALTEVRVNTDNSDFRTLSQGEKTKAFDYFIIKSSSYSSKNFEVKFELKSFSCEESYSLTSKYSNKLFSDIL